MTRSNLFLVLTLAAGLVGGAALAQSPPAPTDPSMPAASAAEPMSSTMPMATPAPMTDPAPAPGPMSNMPAATVTATTMTNGPVPDTAANRAKYGGPKSHAGKHTKPTGN